MFIFFKPMDKFFCMPQRIPEDRDLNTCEFTLPKDAVQRLQL